MHISLIHDTSTLSKINAEKIQKRRKRTRFLSLKFAIKKLIKRGGNVK